MGLEEFCCYTNGNPMKNGWIEKKETIHCLCYFTIIFTLFYLTHHSTPFTSFLNKKIKKPVAGPLAMAQMAQWVTRSCMDAPVQSIAKITERC